MQRLLVGFCGLDADGEEVRYYLDAGVGGFILFDQNLLAARQARNIDSPAQLRALTRALRRAGARVLALDQEGGQVARLKPARGFAAQPAAADFARLPQAQQQHTARQAARQLGGLGINMNFAPVLDLDLNPDNPIIHRYRRSFSAKADVVTHCAAVHIDAMRAEGVLPVGKHFPGHGSASADSHLGMVDVSQTWQEAELSPYRDLARQGRLPAVMTAHVFQRHWDAQHPATLSRDILQGLLRRKIGFSGVIISDDMDMQAITAHFGREEAMALAWQAGVDVLLYGNQLHRPQLGVDDPVTLLRRLLSRGRIRAEHIHAGWQRWRHLCASVR